jgi:hypothetical protein
MPFQSLPPGQRQGKKSVVIVVVVIWVIMTIRTGATWLTPTEVAFVAFLLGQPFPARGEVSD